MAPNDALPSSTVGHAPDTAPPARIRFRQPVNSTGFIDGGWWPRSRDLLAELPGLLDVFWTAGRTMTHLSYNLDQWDAAPRRVSVHGRRVRLAGFHQQNPLTVFLSDSGHRDTAELLVIAAGTAPALAERALDLASAAGGTDRAAQLLADAGAGSAA